jgi:hypothetical protein
MWSSIIAVQLPFGLAPLVSSSLILIWLKSGKSKFVSGNARSGEKSVKPRLSINATIRGVPSLVAKSVLGQSLRLRAGHFRLAPNSGHVAAPQ